MDKVIIQYKTFANSEDLVEWQQADRDLQLNVISVSPFVMNIGIDMGAKTIDTDVVGNSVAEEISGKALTTPGVFVTYFEAPFKEESK